MTGSTFAFDLTLQPGATQRSPAGADGHASLRVEDLPAIAIGNTEAARLVRGRPLGEGGMGRVSLAREPSLDRDVAIKEPIRPEPAVVASLLHEARMMGSLEHPNIIPVHALGVDDHGTPVLVMKRVEGATWEDLLDDPDHSAWSTRRDGTDALLRNVNVLAEVCRALAFAHERGIVHRDLKPENVMIGAHGEVYLLDFGVAERVGAHASQAVGTPAFMAPEMTAPGTVTTAMDVFLLGANLTAVLLGRPRHTGDDVRSVLRCAAAALPEDFPPHIDPELAALANLACAKDPQERIRSVDAFADALEDWKTHRGAAALHDAALAQVDLWARAIERGDPPAVIGAFSAARFGLREALQRWPQHAPSRHALVALLCGAVDNAVARQTDLDSAGSWVEELVALSVPDAQRYADAVAEARDVVDKRREWVRESDFTAGETPRAAFFGVTFLIASVASWFIVGVADATTPAGGIRIFAFWSAWFLVGSAVALFRLNNTQASRSLLLALTAALAVVMCNRVGCWALDLPVLSMYATDLLLLAVGALTLGVYIRWASLILFGALNLVGYGLLVAMPEHVIGLFGIVVAVTPLAFTLPLVRWVRARSG